MTLWDVRHPMTCKLRSGPDTLRPVYILTGGGFGLLRKHSSGPTKDGTTFILRVQEKKKMLASRPPSTQRKHNTEPDPGPFVRAAGLWREEGREGRLEGWSGSGKRSRSGEVEAKGVFGRRGEVRTVGMRR